MNRLTHRQARQLTGWYEKNKRNLPWRGTGDPYHVWISEIMLQQTRIEAVTGKYLAFIEELPDIGSLADCDDDRLMRLWEGLGYYSRARNLKKCAAVLKEKYSGRLPADAQTLRLLPGIGPYTAGAISSIAYGRAEAAVDGNVLRVLARLFAIRDDIRSDQTKAMITDTLSDVLSAGDLDYAALNQGLMELGQTVCVPGTPDCAVCPWKDSCLSYRDHLTEEIPYRSRLKEKKTVERTVLVIRMGDRFLLRKRPQNGLLAGLYEFPGIEGYADREGALATVREMSLEPLRIFSLPDAVHVFTHLEWHMKAYEIRIAETDSVPDHCIFVTKEEMRDTALPSAFRTYIQWYALREWN